MSDPQVSVLVAVHNGERFVAEAIESVLAQTFGDWELVIVDDASTDSTAARLQSFDDARIVVVTRAQSRGLAAALNAGLAHCRAPLVARLDADDRCHPERLARQCARMTADSQLGALGSFVREIDVSGVPIGRRHVPVGVDNVVKTLRWRSALAHPTVMFRKALVLEVGGYRPETNRYEDYDLWLRLAAVCRIDNVDAELLDYRVHPAQVTAKRVFDRRAAGHLGASRMALARARRESVLAAAGRHFCWSGWQVRHAIGQRARRGRPAKPLRRNIRKVSE
jgi:glycosyltransferase involved in cell wall biosynthesis